MSLRQDFECRSVAIGSQVNFWERPFGDGGYLDNKPFTYAIETMKTRHAELPVDRKLIYIEPSPQDIAFEQMQRAGALTRPNAVENSLDALIVLPRYETIRQDLEEVIRWNADISRLHRVIDFINDAIRKNDPTLAGAQSPLNNATYHRLRLSGTSDQLGDRLAAVASVDPSSAQGQAIRSIAGIWREIYYPPKKTANSISDEQTFLGFFDLDYCERAIRFLRLQLQQLRDPALKSESLDELSRIASLFMALDDAPLNLDINAATKSDVAFACWSQYLTFIVDPQAAARAMGIEFPYPDGMATKPPGVVAAYPPADSPSFYSASDAGRDARVRWLFKYLLRNWLSLFALVSIVTILIGAFTGTSGMSGVGVGMLAIVILLALFSGLLRYYMLKAKIPPRLFLVIRLGLAFIVLLLLGYLAVYHGITIANILHSVAIFLDWTARFKLKA